MENQENNQTELTENDRIWNEIQEKESCDDSADRGTALIAWLKEQGETVEPSDLSFYNENDITIGSRQVKSGDAPETIKERVKMVKEALGDLSFDMSMEGMSDPVSASIVISDHWNQERYNVASAWLSEHNPESLKIGLHDVLNTLYFLFAEPDSYGKNYHRLAIRAAWDGKEIEDTREMIHQDNGNYLVLTDSEADDRARESAESFINDCVEIPSHIEPYFDRDRYIDDYIANDRRGTVIASYDNEENEITLLINGYQQTYYIYRIG